MFGKLLAKIKRAMGEREPFDPAGFGDPVAERTEWGPAKGGGASFRTHKLVVVSPDRLEFRASVGALLFYAVFLLLGLGVLIGFSAAMTSSRKAGLNAETLLPLLVGTVFATAGGLMLYFGTAPIVFDRRKGYFWKGRKSPDEVFDRSRIKHFATFADIHALQLLSEYCRSDKNSYYSYELNLVLEDGRRINVVDHGNQAKLREDAKRLSAFLDKPIWDAI